MSRLEVLIQTLCPDGVEYKKLGDVSSIVRGVTYSKNMEVNSTTGYKILRANNITLSSNSVNFADVRIISDSVKVNPNQKLKEKDIFICTASGSKDHIGKVAYIEHDLDYYFGGFMAVIRTKPTLISRFLFHILTGPSFSTYLENTLNSSTINNLNSTILSGFLVPVPPLPVQEEIVRILDTFSGVVTELEQKLEAEQAARVRQYEHYRNELLSFDSKSNIFEKLLAKIRPEGVTYVRLGGKEGICDVVPSGVDKVISNNERPVKLCNYMDVYNNRYITDAVVEKCTDGSVSENEYERFVLRRGQVLLTKDSETREDIAQSSYVNKDFDDVVCGYHLAVLTPVKSINSKYLNYVLQSANLRCYFSKMANGVSRYGLKLKSIEDALIPVPPLEVQKEIVSILDRFSTLVNDLKSGLPAEIALRRKQYEYYRDKLLTFKPLEPTN